MTDDASDDRCEMRGCRRPAERTMEFDRHQDVRVCERHYRRNRRLKHALVVALSALLAAAGLGVYWLVL